MSSAAAIRSPSAPENVLEAGMNAK